MANVALMTIGLLRAPWGDPVVRGFEERVDETFATAAASPGFVVNVDVMDDQGFRSGVFPPPFADPERANRVAATLSVWRDAESAFAFSYRGMHGASLRERHEWFEKVDAPSHVAWWIDEGHGPTWVEAAGRYVELVQAGPSARAFDFRSPFDAAGCASPIDREAVRRYAPTSTIT